MVAIGGGGRRIDETLDLRVARGDQHVEEAGIVGSMGGQRVFDRARHRTERGLVQDVIDPLAHGMAGDEVADVAALEAEIFPALGPDADLDLRQVFLVAGREVVETDDALVEQQQRFHQIAADEAGSPGDEPGARLGFERFLQRIECGHHNLQRVKPAAFTAAGS